MIILGILSVLIVYIYAQDIVDESKFPYKKKK
jgi:hypothetical protein